MSNVATGTLRQRIRIEEKITPQNSDGETEIEWVHVGTFWANVRPSSSRELLLAAQVQSPVDTMIVMRYNVAVKASMRAVLVRNGVDSTIYDLSAPIRDPETGLEWMTIPAKSGVSAG
jgi:SPP1 family predicted phage head-tail adaptor